MVPNEDVLSEVDDERSIEKLTGLNKAIEETTFYTTLQESSGQRRRMHLIDDLKPKKC